MRRPTIKDIAEKANVSGWTVSQVLNGRTTVSIAEKTRHRVLQIAGEVGYRPNYAARALANNRTNLIAILMRTHENYSPYYGNIQHHLQILARRNGYQCITEDVAIDEVDRVEFSKLMSWPMDGAFACDVCGLVSAYTAINTNERLPIVSVGALSIDSIDYVHLDLYSGALDAVRHLIDVGCRRISYVGRLPYDMRADAYAKVLQEHNRPEEYIACPEDSRFSGRSSMLEYVKANGTPDGIFCENDELAIGCYRALTELGIRIPEDVAIVGCDGIDDTAFQARQISTISVPIHDLCEKAWNFLENRITHPDLPQQQHVIIPKLIVRQSSQR